MYDAAVMNLETSLTLDFTFQYDKVAKLTSDAKFGEYLVVFISVLILGYTPL